MSNTRRSHTQSSSTAGAEAPVGRKHARLLEFLSTRGQVAFEARQVERARRLLKEAHAELLGPLPANTSVAVIDGWVRRISLKCSEAAALWPALVAGPPALARLEEIELLFDDGLEAWITAATDRPLVVTRFHLNAQYCDLDTGELLDQSEGSARVVAAANALANATELVCELYLDEHSSLAGLDLPDLTTLEVNVLPHGPPGQDGAVLATLWQARCPQLRHVGWQSHGEVDPGAVLVAPWQVTELGIWSANYAAVLAVLVAERPWLTAIGVADPSMKDDPGDDALRELGEGRKLFGVRCDYVRGYNLGHRLLHALGRRADGAAQFAALRARNCQDADVHFQCANAVEDDQLKVDAFCEALVLDPDHGPAHNNLGNALMRLERWRPAIYHFRRWLEINPEKFSALHDVIAAHRALGEEDEARAAEAELPPG